MFSKLTGYEKTKSSSDCPKKHYKQSKVENGKKDHNDLLER